MADPNAGTSREHNKQQARGSDDRNIPDPSGVIIRADPPPSPAELKARVTLPGVGGEEGGSGGSGGGKDPASLRQPPSEGAGTGPSAPVTPSVSGIEIMGEGKAAPAIPINPGGPAERR